MLSDNEIKNIHVEDLENTWMHVTWKEKCHFGILAAQALQAILEKFKRKELPPLLTIISLL